MQMVLQMIITRKNRGVTMHDDENYRFIVGNQYIELTVKENKILKILIENKNRVVTFEQLCMALYNDPLDIYYRSNIALLIRRLRKKLGQNVHIKNKFGIGYTIP